jgi:uncharacterized membrane protein YraQ (UPF0718 family)
MNPIVDLLSQSLFKVWVTFTHNWPFLLASVLISVALKLYLDPQKVSAWITRYRRAGIMGATAAAVATPFCSCGTTAVILGMIASTIPWAPIVAFMVASPLTSPEELIYSAGIFGWPFAIAFFISSILLGLLGGFAAEFLETRGWLANQARFSSPAAARSAPRGDRPVANSADRQPARYLPRQPLRRPVLAAAGSAAAAACCAPAAPAPETGCGCGAAQSATLQAPYPVFAAAPQAAFTSPTCSCADQAAAVQPRPGIAQWVNEVTRTGGKLLAMFLGFAFIGYVLNGLIPSAWVAAIFGSGNIYSVPLAAALGLPLYINTEGSLPLVRALIDGGMSQGAALAFLITGAGTSIGAITGALAIARWRVIALVVSTLWVGAVIMGYAYNLLLAAHWF